MEKKERREKLGEEFLGRKEVKVDKTYEETEKITRELDALYGDSARALSEMVSGGEVSL